MILFGATGTSHPKLRELTHSDIVNLEPARAQLAGDQACMFCLDISSFRMSEKDYKRITYALTLSAAKPLRDANPSATFVYVSGRDTDSSGEGPAMWARIKGPTENALQQMPFAAMYMARPGATLRKNGIKSKTSLYNAFYAVFELLYPLLRRKAPDAVTNTHDLGRALIEVAKRGAGKKILENGDLNAIAKARRAS